MSQIELAAADGHRLGAYVAAPAGKPRGAIVVVQEIFGVNSHIRSVADGYAADGWLAVAPALFDRIERGVETGYADADIQRGIALKGASSNDKALLDIAAAIAHAAKAGGAKVGIVGYCWGGLLAWMAACKLDGLACAVCYYGGGMPDQKSLVPRCPVLAHFGDKDHAIPLQGVQAFRTARPEVEVHLYAAGHGFNCDQRGSYDAAAAKLARERSLAFFERHLG
ncbi:MAG TPA: dienelactone hydrolase family protein [Ideonella sp.]|nr:dienelactone hydrolase family protein [Ideonella sp.]